MISHLPPMDLKTIYIGKCKIKNIEKDKFIIGRYKKKWRIKWYRQT